MVSRWEKGGSIRAGEGENMSDATARKLSMKTIPVHEAVGTVLCHDITRIVPGEFKGPVFRKGHVVTPEDIPILLQTGKENLYVYEPSPGLLHEDDAARRICAAAMGDNLTLSKPKEGRINALASCQGLLVVDVERLKAVNGLGEVSFATRHSMQEVAEGEAVAGTRVIPLIVGEALLEAVEDICRPEKDGGFRPIVEVRPFRSLRVGLVTTGSEIYSGRIQDKFGPVLTQKFSRLGSSILGQTLTSDDEAMTRDAILDFIARGADMVAVTGGMSVDPDDRTPASIRAAGGVVERYGAPTFPGSMFLLAHIGDVPVLGLPGCVMYHQASIFDLIVPRLLAGIKTGAEDIAALGHGGYCTGCAECRYPDCAFGKG
jgi:hypothetical protein